MDSLYIERHDVVQRYLRNTLSEEELDSFEEFIIANPAIIERIEQQRHINAAFRAEADSLLPGKLSFNRYVPGLFKSMALAACLLLAVFMTIDRDQSLDVRGSLRAPVVLQSLRGADQVFDLSGEPQVQLQIDVGPQLDAGERYALRLMNENTGIEAAQAAGLQADAEGWLLYTVDTGQSLQGRYLLEVSGSASGSLQRFVLNFQ